MTNCPRRNGRRFTRPPKKSSAPSITILTQQKTVKTATSTTHLNWSKYQLRISGVTVVVGTRRLSNSGCVYLFSVTAQYRSLTGRSVSAPFLFQCHMCHLFSHSISVPNHLVRQLVDTSRFAVIQLLFERLF